MIYFPHFLSWVILAGVFVDVLSPSDGVIGRAFTALGLKPIFFLGRSEMVSVYYGSYGYLERVWIWNDCISGSSDRY